MEFDRYSHPERLKAVYEAITDKWNPSNVIAEKARTADNHYEFNIYSATNYLKMLWKMRLVEKEVRYEPNIYKKYNPVAYWRKAKKPSDSKCSE